ncbi:hypothetical protein N0V86_004963 [Didymella sp. IMI 355093]|nr:hypothetical protein N0V86_004963 [Didymella sp. IMI 355093]
MFSMNHVYGIISTPLFIFVAAGIAIDIGEKTRSQRALVVKFKKILTDYGQTPVRSNGAKVRFSEMLSKGLTESQSMLCDEMDAAFRTNNDKMAETNDNLRQAEKSLEAMKKEAKIEKIATDSTIHGLKTCLQIKTEEIAAKNNEIQEVETQMAEVTADLHTVLDAEKEREHAGKTINEVAVKYDRN